MATKIENSIIETPGDRLNIVITKYFQNQQDLANIINVDQSSLSSYINGRYTITKKLANKMQKTAGINADYILNGNLPMMLDEKRKPIVSRISKINAKTTELGIIKHFILRYEGNQHTLSPDGEGSVINVVLGNIEDDDQPFRVLNNVIEFEEKYNISMSASIILKKNYRDNDLVLYYNGAEYEIGVFYKNKIIEMGTDIGYNINDEGIDIKGRVVGKFENIKLKSKNKKTGRIF